MRSIPALLAAAGAAAAPAPTLPSQASTSAPTQTAAPAQVTSAEQTASPVSQPAPAARLPGFAAQLANQAPISGPNGWQAIPYDKAWAAIARATPATRQAARWDYARSLIASGLGAEAAGVLEVMKADDPDLALVPSWQLAHGVALGQMRHSAEALAQLGADALASNPEAALWRMRILAEAGLDQQALVQFNAGLPALNARTPGQRIPFILAASRSAVDTGRPAMALDWLKHAPDSDPSANLLRGKAYFAMGELQSGRLRLQRVNLNGDPESKMDARLSNIEEGVLRGGLDPKLALKQLDAITFGWRGGDIEERALRLSLKIASDQNDLRHSLAAGASLFRYFNLGKETGPLIARLQAQLASALAPDSRMPLEQAAGLYWDFKDLAPQGAEGDLLVNHLANRLQTAGLYGRAAELLQYQLSTRAQDVTQGPLSVKVASLFILAGHPERALRALQATDSVPYPADMSWDRRRVEAAALHLLGKTSEALAVLQDVPDANLIKTEIYWKRQDWASLAAADEAALPGRGTLSEVGQVIVLRHAIALAMLRQEDALASLRARYGSAFAQLPTASTFDILTRPVGAIDPAALSKAMASLPSASPAGGIADLLDAQPVQLSQS